VVNVADMIYPVLKNQLDQLAEMPFSGDESRFYTLNKLLVYLKQKSAEQAPIALNFICTHNSRRSHLAQAWAAAWIKYYQINDVSVFSGGTEATACHPNAVAALKADGFEIDVLDSSINPKYLLKTGQEDTGILLFSKKFDAPENPESHFVAIMVCSDADEACPFVLGCDLRISLPFNDPKSADNTPNTAATYLSRSREIGAEIGFVFREWAKG